MKQMGDAQTNGKEGTSLGCTAFNTTATSTHIASSNLPERKPFLLILHQEKSNPGRIGQWLVANGFPLDIRKPRFGCPLPETLESHAGAVIFGGPMSANDPDDFIKQETDWIDVPLREEKPFLGVCLGAQMLSRNLGGSVAPCTQASIEVGYYPLELTDAARNLCEWPERVYQWHTEGFTMPDTATRLAGTERFPNQAMTYGSAAAAVQFHPEITYALVNRWTSSRPDRLATKGARPRHEHFENHFRHADVVAAWLDTFMTRLLQAKLQTS